MSEIRSQATPARDELAERLMELWGWLGPDAAKMLVEQVEAAGWSKPRTVNSVEELEALPPGSVIKLPDGEVGMIMVARDKRHVVGYPQCLPTSELAEVIRSTYGDPIRVLFTPGEAG